MIGYLAMRFTTFSATQINDRRGEWRYLGLIWLTSTIASAQKLRIIKFPSFQWKMKTYQKSWTKNFKETVGIAMITQQVKKLLESMIPQWGSKCKSENASWSKKCLKEYRLLFGWGFALNIEGIGWKELGIKTNKGKIFS